MSNEAPLDRLGAVPATRHCLDLAVLDSLPEDPQALSHAIDAQRSRADAHLADLFAKGTDITELVHARAWAVEQLVLALWERLLGQCPFLCLLAVGGFGRGELHPHSDLDVLILHHGPSQLDELAIERLSQFVQVLWDANLHPGHSVRTIEGCLAKANSDVGVMTNVMEHRLIAGDPALYGQFVEGLSDPALWPAALFFEAKVAEQTERYAQFEDTIYNLEPNLKEGPGGLRDVQMIAWVAHRYFQNATLHGLVEHDFLSEDEYQELVLGRAYLWSLRWVLHQLAGRAEERLLFDHQRKLAEAFGYSVEGAPATNGEVEQFMQRYYRVAMRLARLNERLLQSFEEELLTSRAHLPSSPIDDDFQITDGYLELIDPQGFVYQPLLLIKMFNLLAQHQDILGVRAATIRLVKEHLYLIDESFRKDPEVLAMFFDLLKSPKGVYHQLARMNRYGVLGALLPAFAKITGRMQFDLFHVYTVDQHTMFVIRNLRRFANGEYADRFSHAISVFGRIDGPELLYLAALFHDIAKGRGGDHSILGAEDARAFCACLPIDQSDQALVAWLVKEHLSLSQTSQREDISDPKVVHRFASKMPDRRHLDHLYVLTVADIAATSPSLWNSWKDSLLWSLYEASAQALEGGLDEAPDEGMGIAASRQASLEAFDQSQHERVGPLWDTLPKRAFLKLDPAQLIWTTSAVLANDARPLVVTRTQPDKGISEVFVHAIDFPGLFALVARELDRMQLNVVAARIITTSNNLSWDIFQVMDQDAGPIHPQDAKRLEAVLVEQLAAQQVRPLPPKPVPRRLQPFMDPAQIALRPSAGGLSALDIHATDRPGLLSAIAETLVALDLRLLDARIATFGQRVEDVFVIGQDHQGQTVALDKERSQRLIEQLHARLDT